MELEYDNAILNLTDLIDSLNTDKKKKTLTELLEKLLLEGENFLKGSISTHPILNYVENILRVTKGKHYIDKNIKKKSSSNEKIFKDSLKKHNNKKNNKVYQKAKKELKEIMIQQIEAKIKTPLYLRERITGHQGRTAKTGREYKPTPHNKRSLTNLEKLYIHNYLLSIGAGF